MSNVILIIGLLYILAALLIWLGLWIKQRPGNDRSLSTASLIICARNEEKDLPACLESVERQTLESDRLEVILVDDASADGTGQLMEEYANRSRYPVRILHLAPPEAGEPSGKWRPLKEGIKLAVNEGLLLTDADAILSPTWAQSHLVELGKGEIAAGFALINGTGLWNRVQGLDWLFLLGVASSLARLGVPQAALGKNLSVRRRDYEAVGGLDAIGYSLTEDRALIQALVRNGGTVRFPFAADMMVSTPGEPTWNDYMHQRKRWASGIRQLRPTGKACMATMILRHFAVIIGILSGIPEALGIWVVSAAANFVIHQKITSSLGLKNRLQYFVFWEIFSTWTAPLQAVHILRNRRVLWKGRRFPDSTQASDSAGR